MMRSLLLAGLMTVAVTGAQAQSASPFPDGPGQQLVAFACTQCHQAGPITQLRMSEDAWRRQIYNMVLRGAQIGPDDIDTAAHYMAAKFGPGVPLPNQPHVAVTLPAGDAMALVSGGCGLCHGLDRVVATNRPGEQWNSIVHRMVEIGAPLSRDQADKVTAYLKANYAGG